MTWVVEAAYGCGTFVRHFDTPTAAHGWERLDVTDQEALDEWKGRT